MVARSQNGYVANDRDYIASYTVPGTKLRIALRKGDVSVVLLEYLRRYHIEVESLYHQPQDLWGYAERTIRGSSTTLSNHASGTAVDARAVDHPLGAVGTFNAVELHALNRLLAYFEGVLRHGKDYRGRKDEMHAEIVGSPAEVARIANKIRSGAPSTISPIPPVGALPVLSTGSNGRHVEVIQRFLGITVDGDFGPATEKAVRDYQQLRGMTVDGVVGPATWAATGLYPPAGVAPSPAPRDEEDDLRDDERLWLQTIYNQITGNNFEGWPTWGGGTGEKLSLVDYARRDNVETRQVRVAVDKLAAKVDALSARPVGDVDPEPIVAAIVDAGIAEQVVEALAARLARTD